jgi:hypothetical protein
LARWRNRSQRSLSSSSRCRCPRLVCPGTTRDAARPPLLGARRRSCPRRRGGAAAPHGRVPVLGAPRSQPRRAPRYPTGKSATPRTALARSRSWPTLSCSPRRIAGNRPSASATWVRATTTKHAAPTSCTSRQVPLVRADKIADHARSAQAGTRTAKVPQQRAAHGGESRGQTTEAPAGRGLVTGLSGRTQAGKGAETRGIEPAIRAPMPCRLWRGVTGLWLSRAGRHRRLDC